MSSSDKSRKTIIEQERQKRTRLEVLKRSTPTKSLCPFESDKKFCRTLIDSAPNIILFLSDDHKILDFNPEAELVYGRSRNEVVGKNYLELFVPEEERAAVTADIKKVLTGEPTRGFENKIINRNGEHRIIRWNVGRVEGIDGQAVGIVATGQDITSQKEMEAEVRSSQERLKILFENAPDAIFLSDLKGNLVDGNRVAEELAGYSKSELIGKNVFEVGLLSSEEIPKASENLKKITLGQQTGPDEYTLKRKDGTFVTLEISNFPVKIEKEIFSLGIARDITERKKAEQALNESLKTSDDIINVIPSGLFLYKYEEPDRLILLRCNPEAVRLTRINPEDCVGKEFNEIWPGAKQNGVTDIFLEAIKTGKVFAADEFHYKDDRDEGFVKIRVFNLPGRKLAVAIENINPQKKAIDALRESERRYRELYQSSRDAWASVDMDGKFLEWNSAYAEMLGYEDDQIARLTYKDVTSTKWHDYEAEIINKQVLTRGYSDYYEKEYVRKDGTVFPVEIRTYLLKDKNGKPSNMWAFVRDVTERKKAEEALRESEGKMRAMLQSIGDHIGMMDKDLNILWANDIAKRLFGDDIIGKKCYEVYRGRKKPCEPFPCLTLKAFEDGQIHKDETQVKCLDGTILDYACTASPALFDEEGNPTAVIEVSRDITDRKKIERELELERAQLISIFDSIDEVIYVVDIETYEVLYVNQAMQDRFQKKLIGGLCYEEFQNLNAPCEFCTNKIIMQQKPAPYRWDYHNPTVDRDYAIVDRIIKWPDGRDVRFEVAIDITERKRAEEALKYSERSYREIFNNCNEMIFIHDYETGEIVDVNKTVCDTLGYSFEEIKKMNVGDLSINKSPYTQKEALQWIEKASNEGPQYFEWLAKDRFGKLIWVENCLIRAQIAGKDRILVFCRNITDRKQAEEELLRYACIVSNSNDMMSILDTNFVYLAANNAYLAAFGMSKEEFVGHTISEVFGEDLFERIIKPKAEHCLKGNKVSYEDWFQFPVHGSRFFSISYSPYWGSEGQIKGFVVNAKDITERKEAEEKILRYQERLRFLASELSLVEERQRRSLATDLHDNTSQELALSLLKLQTMRNSIDKGSRKKIDEICKLLQKTSENVRSLTFELCSPTLYNFGLEMAIAELMEERLGKIEGISYKFCHDKELKPLTEDIKITLFQAVRELITNIIKHANAQNVLINVSKVNNILRIEINDDGIGFELDEPESFERSKKGFGLFNVRERLNYIGSSIQIESSPGKGTSVVIEAPLNI